MDMPQPSVPLPLQKDNASLTGFIVAIGALVIIGVLWWLVGTQWLQSPPSYLGSTTLLVSIGLAVLFLIVGFAEMFHQAGVRQASKRAYLVPVLFIFIGIVLTILVVYNGIYSGPGVYFLGEIAGLLVVLIVGTIAFFAMDRFHATHALIAPISSNAGSGPTIIIQNKTSSGGKIMTFIMLIIIIVVLYVLYLIVQDVMGIANAAKCGFIFCGI
jgi:hypothetical protein